MKAQFFHVLLGLAVSALLASCGGGSSSNPISGVAATGAPIANASVFLKDADGNEPAGQSAATGVAVVTTDADGKYEFSSALMKGLKSPFIIRVSGSKVLDNGDDATAILHAVVASTNGATANLTPLTEAAAILTLGTDTASAFSSPEDTLGSFTSQAAQDANSALLAKLVLPSGMTNLDLVSSPLDAAPSADLSNPSAAKKHDMLLDTMSFSTSQGQFILADRNRPENEYVGGPTITITPGAAPERVTARAIRLFAGLPSARKAASTAVASGTMSGVSEEGLLDATKLQAFISRLNAKLAAGCSVPLSGDYDDASCDGLVNPANAIFSTAYKHTGLSAAQWLSSWVATPLDVEDLSGVTVSLRAAYRGSFMATSTQRVTRVALTFSRTNASGNVDYVNRTMLLADEGANITVFGNQKNIFLWARPRLSVFPDADDTYPFNPRHQVGMQFILKTWWAGQKDMVIGAHIDGPGLPASRLANRSGPSGEASNPNGLASGIEIFKRTDDAAGCSNMAVDPSVYMEKNQKTWTAAWNDYKASRNRNVLFDGRVRWRDGNTTCDPTFDMRRYYGSRTSDWQTLTLPKRGDFYTVTLYLDASKWTGPGQPALPVGATTTPTSAVNADGKTIRYYPLVVREYLRADAFNLPVAEVPAAQLPGVTDATRSRLRDFARDGDRQIDWTRNLIAWPDKNADGTTAITTFGNFYVGTFLGAYDQMFSLDTGYGAGFDDPENRRTWDYPIAGVSSIKRGFKDYRDFFGNVSTTSGISNLSTSAVADFGIEQNGGGNTSRDGRSFGRLDKLCGQPATFKGATVRVRVRKVTILQTGNQNDRVYEEVSCAAAKLAVGLPTDMSLLGEETTGDPYRTSSGWYWIGTNNNAFYRNTNSGSSETIRYQYDVVRERNRFSSDKGTQVTGNQLSRTLTWAQMMGKEAAGSQALCSAFAGAWPYRSAYVIMIDMNGRMIKETREVHGDFPAVSDVSDGSQVLAQRYTTTANLQSALDLWNGVTLAGSTSVPSIRYLDVTRPATFTDSLHLAMNFDVSDYDLDWTIPVDGTGYAWDPTGNKWHGQPGVIQPAYIKASASATSCTKKVW